MFSPVDASEHDNYLAGLNRNFTGWGGRSRLAWALRPFGGQEPDIFARSGGEGLVAGSIVSYRLVGDDQQACWVGVMTGSWTDPEARGRGLFTEMIARSVALVRNRGGVALVAFVTADNASRRRLEAAGSVMIPTWYVSVPIAVDDHAGWQDADRVDVALAELDAKRTIEAGDRWRFVYPEAADLRRQLLERSDDARVLISGSGDVAVVERSGHSLRVLATSGSNPAPDFPGTHDLFTFTSDPAVGDEARRRVGSRVTEGYLTILPVVDDWLPPRRWAIESGDRI